MGTGKGLVLFAILFSFLFPPVAVGGKIDEDCTYNGVKLNGRVKVVTSFETFRVKVVDAFCDIRVREVSAFPNQCGEWQPVDAFEDFSVRFVDSFEDFRICQVAAFPGVR